MNVDSRASLSAGGQSYFLDGSDIDTYLGSSGRVYLAGHLGRPQEGFAHIASLPDPTEVGISRYADLTIDQPHLHTANTDFAYVLKGTFAVRIIPTGEVRVLGEGGLYVIEPGIAHVCIAHPSTEVLFVKVPGGNDKTVVELDEASRDWTQQYCDAVRSQ